MKRWPIQLIRLLSILSGLSILSMILLSLIFPDFDWARKKLYLGAQFHYLDVPASMAVFSLIVLLFYLLALQLFLHLKGLQRKLVTSILWGMIVISEAVMILLFHGILPPGYDGGHTYTQAVNLLHQGSQATILSYFQIYPNNIGITVVRFWLYRLFSFNHAALFPYIDQSACAVSLTLGIYFSWKFLREALNRKAADILLILVMTCLPLLFYIVYFYTDSISLMFPPVLLYLVYRYRKYGKLSIIVWIGLVLGISFQIRENMILMLPAMILYFLLIRHFKKALIGVVVCLLFISATGFAAHGYEKTLGFEPNPRLQMPSSDWLLMGLSHSGRYNVKDYQVAMKQPTPQKKQQADLQAIAHRIQSKGLIRLAGTWVLKDARTFGDGSMAYFWQTYDTTNYSVSYEYLFGYQKQLVLFLIQVFHIVLLILLLFSGIFLLHHRKYDENLFIQLCIFISFIFYVFVWEAEPRYALLFTLLECCSAVYGILEVRDLIRNGYKKVRVKSSVLVPAMFGLICLFSVTVGIGLNNYNLYTQIPIPRNQYSVNQGVAKGKQGALVDRFHNAAQTFQAGRPFDRVAFGILRHSGNAVYQVTVSEWRSSHPLLRKTIWSAMLKKRGLLIFRSRTLNNTNGQHPYTLRIRQLSGVPGSRLVLAMNGRTAYEQWDLYPQGSLYENGNPVSRVDLQFKIYQAELHPYLDDEFYNTMIGSLLIVILAAIVILFRVTWNSGKKVKLITDRA